MQILTLQQVESRYLIIKKSAQMICVPGISFQNRLFVSDRVFNYKDRKKAIRYCETMYLADKGSELYLLLDEANKLTVWREEESARIAGSESPENVVQRLISSRFMARLQNLNELSAGDRYLFTNNKIGKNLIKNLECSLNRAVDLSRELMN